METLQILRAIELPDYGWANHPAVLMWRGRTPALVAYGLAMARIWRSAVSATAPSPRSASSPRRWGCRRPNWPMPGCCPWLGDEALHRSHRSNLIAKDPGFYRPRFAELFGPEPDDLPYVWPEADDVAPAPEPQGVRVWVVRPRAHGDLGACLAAGVVGLGVQSGIDVDATGLSPAELRALSKELTGRRPAKDLRQLSAFLDEIGWGTGSACRSSTAPGCCSGRSPGVPVRGPRAAAAPSGPVGPVPRTAAARDLQDPRA